MHGTLFSPVGVGGEAWAMCFVCAVPSGAGPDGVSSARFTQACAIRDPNSGYVFDLNPLNSSEGYVVSGIGKTFLVRCL